MVMYRTNVQNATILIRQHLRQKDTVTQRQMNMLRLAHKLEVNLLYAQSAKIHIKNQYQRQDIHTHPGLPIKKRLYSIKELNPELVPCVI